MIVAVTICMSKEQQKIIIYQEPDGKIAVEVNLAEGTVWLTQAQMQVLFDKNKRTISEHINDIFKEGELKRKGIVRKFRTVRQEGQRQVERELDHYNLDIIISVGADTRTWIEFLAKEKKIVWALLRRKIRIKGPLSLLSKFGKCFP